MATFDVTGPDGKTYEVTAPDGASEQEIIAYVQQNMAKPSAPAQPLTRGERFAQGLKDPISGGAQLLTKMLPEGIVQAGNRLNNLIARTTGLVAELPEGGVDQQVREQEQAYQSRRGADAGMDWMRLAGNIANPVNVAIGAGAPAAASTLGRIAAGAAGGAASSALAPVTSGDFATEKAKQVGVGSLFGAATPAIAQGVSRVVSPRASTNPQLQMLREAGVKPTIGQTLGGTIGNLEQKATSLPLVGNMIGNQRRQAVEQFNKAALDRVVAPIGGQIDEIGTAGVQKAGDQISRAYDDALSQIKVVKFDNQFSQDFGQLKNMAKGLTPEMSKTFDRKINSVLGARTSQIKTMLPETFKKVESELGELASRYRASSTASEKELGDAFLQAQALIREQAARSNPQAAESLRRANSAWASLVRVEGAAKAAQNAEGVFTPAQLASAVRMADKSARKRSTARGTALMQDLSTAGQQVLGNTVPDSGTAGRLLPVLGAGGLGYGAATGAVDPLITGALLGTGLGLYSAPVQSLLRGAVASRPELAQPLARAIEQTSPRLIPAGSQIGLGLLYNPSP